MSAAVPALFGTAGLLLATSDGEGAGAAGSGVACACSGAGVTCAGRGACVAWLAPALIRASEVADEDRRAERDEAVRTAAGLDDWIVAAGCGPGAGGTALGTGAVLLMPPLSGAIAICCGGGAIGAVLVVFAATIGLCDEPELA